MRFLLYKKQLFCLCVVVTVLGAPRLYGIVAGSPHDFSPGRDGSQACQFCHTPHMALANTPLWNHTLSNAVYTIYQSSSLDAEVGQPTGSSKLCLSCHDGTIALESSVRGGGGTTLMPPGKANIGTDLSDDHPISFIYSADLAAKDPQLRDPSSLPEELALDKFGEMQCVTCHDPHDDTFGKFLVLPNIKSNLCLKCHDLYGWTGSIHETSNALVQGANDTFLKETGYQTVSDNGCLSCHRSHSAGHPERLFHFEKEEDNCFSCHNGQVAKNMINEFQKFSGHFVGDYEGIHDIRELAGDSNLHVECEDCHNPHAMVQSVQAPVAAPNIQGALKGVSGVSASGAPIEHASYEYEVCFKCHGNNLNRVDTTISRQITQTNTLLEFDQSNPSFHPVTARGANPNVPSLISSLNETLMIYCTDCHSSDSSSQVKGPHGSQNPFLLAHSYETADGTEESVFAYELCYQCHDRDSILNDRSFEKHHTHITDEKTPCSVCHDPHGISYSQGNSTNKSNLINFDMTVVFPDPVTGRLEFEDLGDFRGRCYLECHGEQHSPETYEP